MPHWGRGGISMKYHPRVVFSFIILSFFVTPKFARVRRLNFRISFYQFLSGLLHMTSILGYCLPRGYRPVAKGAKGDRVPR